MGIAESVGGVKNDCGDLENFNMTLRYAITGHKLDRIHIV